MSLPESIDDSFSKKRWIRELWEETEHDETMRDFIFGDVIEAMEAWAGEIADEREDTIRYEARVDVVQDLKDNPPEDLRAAIIRGLIEYPPAGMDESLGAWRELRRQIRDEARETFRDEIDDMQLTIEALREEIAQLKGEEYEPPKSKGKVWR